MNWELIKHKLWLRLIATTAILLAGAMVRGRCRLHAALGCAAWAFLRPLCCLNAVCGILLGAPSRTAEAVLPATHKRPAVQLQVCAAGTPPDNTPTLFVVIHITASPARFLPWGLAAKKALCYNEETNQG